MVFFKVFVRTYGFNFIKINIIIHLFFLIINVFYVFLILQAKVCFIFCCFCFWTFLTILSNLLLGENYAVFEHSPNNKSLKI